MKFYSVGLKSHVDVDDKNVKCKMTKNNKYMAYAEKDGKKLVKFINKADYDRLMKE